MKRYQVTSVVLLIIATVSCQKEYLSSDGEIILRIGDNTLREDVETKATPVTTIPSTLYWGATTGNGTESVKWSAASAGVSSGTIHTGKYQTYSPTTYNYYVANQTFTSGGNMTVANNNIDIIAGRASSNSTTPSITLNHIFARTGSLSFVAPSDYSISATWRIKSKGAVTGTAGTFNMQTQSWSASSATLSKQVFTGSSDLWLIPGVYTISVSFTMTKGDFTKSYTQTADITLTAGKQNNITATTTIDEAVQVSFGVLLSAWAENPIALASEDFE